MHADSDVGVPPDDAVCGDCGTALTNGNNMRRLIGAIFETPAYEWVCMACFLDKPIGPMTGNDSPKPLHPDSPDAQ